MVNIVQAEIVSLPIVLIESPYQDGDRATSLRYLAWCEYDSASRGEAPISSHGNCTIYWPEDEEHRAKGFAWRDAIRKVCSHVVYYVDLGMSSGMYEAEKRDISTRVKTLLRRLPEDLLSKFRAYSHPPGSMQRTSVALPVNSSIFGG